MIKKILLLGSGELGKEVVIAAKRLGQYVIACDSYSNAPAMQVADESEVFSMLDADSLKAIVEKHKPDLIVPEIEAIRTELFFEFEQSGIQVVPSAKAANFTMNRQAIRDLASRELGIRTAKYFYADSVEQCLQEISTVGFPCVVKPLMSSSGKGQSFVANEEELKSAFDYAIENARGDVRTVIVEEFVKFHTEITLLTVTQNNGKTLFAPPIGHRQARGDYQESWIPCSTIKEQDIVTAQEMARKVTNALGGSGIWGVEFFVTDTEVVFSELSPRPHDTGMVTLSGCLNLNEFELHVRAILGLPISEINLKHPAASAVVLAASDSATTPQFDNVEKALEDPSIDVKIFGKPSTRKYRRMAVVLATANDCENEKSMRDRAVSNAQKIRVNGELNLLSA